MATATPLVPASDPFRVNGHTNGDQYGAKLVALAGGGYVAAWMSQDRTLRSQLFDSDGQRLGSEFIIAGPSAASSFGARFDLVPQKSGGFAVAWDMPDGMRMQLFDEVGQRLGDQISVAVNATSSDPNLTELDTGHLLVTHSYQGLAYVQIYAADGTPTTDKFAAGTSHTSLSGSGAVTALPGGGFAIVRTVGNGNPLSNTPETQAFDVKAQIFGADGTPITGEFLVHDNLTYRQSVSSVATFENGNFAVVFSDYRQHPFDNGDTLVQVFNPAGQRVGNVIELPGDGPNGGGRQSGASAYAVPGGIAISWSDFWRTDSSRVMFIDENGTVLANDIVLGVGQVSDIALLANGQIAFAGYRNDDSMIQLFSADFQKLGDPLNLTPALDGLKEMPQVAVGADGRLLVLWNANDGSGRGLEAQLLAPLAQGTPNADYLTGTAGNDLLDGKAGADTLEGGLGDDTYMVDDAGDRVIERAGEGSDTIYAATNYTLAADAFIEFLRAAPGNKLPLVLTGNDLAQVISGNGANNVLVGGGGADLLIGGGGNDTYVVDAVGNSSDTVVETANGGFDRVAALTSYALHADSEVEVLEALNLSGTERLDLSGNSYAQVIGGNNGVNVIYAFAGADTIYGYGGDDYLTGGEGADTLYGGLGNDTYYLLSAEDAASDRIYEYAGEGTDRIATATSFTLTAGLSIEILEAIDSTGLIAMDLTGNEFDNIIGGNNDVNTLRGGGGNDILAGYDRADQLFGDGGDDVLIGGTGADLMVGGTGSDKFYVDEAGDVIVEASGEGSDVVAASVSYTLAAGTEIERLEPVTFNSRDALEFTGNEFANHILGNNGANILNGGRGADTLEGLGGADYFLFDTTLGGGNVDRISDYLSSFDRFMLDNSVFTGLQEGALAPGAFNTGLQAKDADDRILYDPSTGAVLFDVDGAGGQDAVQFAWVGTNLTISSTDFLVI